MASTVSYVKLQYFNGDLYEGYWLNPQGCPHGYGTYTWQDGLKYEGSWRKGLKHGYGSQTYPSGDKYEGGWKDGQWHGYGELTQTSLGRTYFGGFASGLEHGYAQIRRGGADNRFYDGGVRQGQRHGYGNLTTPLGTMEGGYKYNKQDGWQEVKAPMRHDYSGTYRDGKMWGVGRMVEYASGKTFDGVWENNDYKGPLTYKK